MDEEYVSLTAVRAAIILICVIIALASFIQAFAEEHKYVISLVTEYGVAEPKAVHIVYDYESECEEAYERMSKSYEESAKKDPDFSYLMYECTRIVIEDGPDATVETEKG